LCRSIEAGKYPPPNSLIERFEVYYPWRIPGVDASFATSPRTHPFEASGVVIDSPWLKGRTTPR